MPYTRVLFLLRTNYRKALKIFIFYIRESFSNKKDYEL